MKATLVSDDPLSSCERVGDVQVAGGKLQEALDAYQQSLNICRTLADRDKSNAGFERP
jgi:predicted negative regulator of RcsB-dependent stress response